MESIWNGFNAKCQKKTTSYETDSNVKKTAQKIINCFNCERFFFFHAHMHSSDANKSWTFIKSGPRS